MANVIALVLGSIYLLVGVVGFVLNPAGGLLLGIFAVNPFHHVFHIALGLSGIVAARWGKGRLYAQVSGTVLLFLGLLGLGATPLTTALIATPGANILTDNLLHLVTGTALAYFGFLPISESIPRQGTEQRLTDGRR